MTNFIIQILPYLNFIGLLTIAASLYTIHKTINHQREIKSIKIRKELRTKLLDDFISSYAELFKGYSNFQFKGDNISDNKGLSQWFEIASEIQYCNHKIKMLLTKDTREQYKIKLLSQEIYLLVFDIIGKKETTDLNKTIGEKKMELSEICSSYVEKERTEIENLITKKPTNVFTRWLIKSWKEVGEYKA